MKAIDTVMNYRECMEATLPITPPYTSFEMITMKQAEISFKAGMQEIVNWLNNRTGYEEMIPIELEEIKKKYGLL